jgi:glycosyltransferase involved in cell wall biosynthesis
MIDNGSDDASTEFIKAIPYDNVEKVFNKENIRHGPALHQAAGMCKTPYLLTMDSDVELNSPGVVELMLSQIKANGLYAVGWLRFVNDVGVAPSREEAQRVGLAALYRYVHPSLAVYDMRVYKLLAPFNDTGAPIIDNMKDAHAKGYKVGGVRVWDYATHWKAGTRRMFKGAWDPKTKQEACEWDPTSDYPI